MNLEKVSLWRRVFQWKSVCDEINAEFDSHRSIHQMFERKLEHHKEQIEAHKSELEKAKAGNRTALKFIMQAHGLKLKLAILFMGIALPCMAAFPPSYIHNNLDTNIVGTAPADGWFLVSTSSVPKWSINGGALTNLAGVAVAQGTNILTTTNGQVVTVNGLTDTNVVNILASNTTPSIVQGTNIVLTTNNHAVTVNGLTDTNVVNILLGAVTNGAILNLSNYVAAIRALDPLVTDNSILVEDFPNANNTANQVGTHGWYNNKLGGANGTGGAGLAGHPGIFVLSTGTTSGDGVVIGLGNSTNNTSTELYPALDTTIGWTNTWIFHLRSTNDCTMWMGLVNNLIFITTEPADWIGLIVASNATSPLYRYTCRAGASSHFANGPALDQNVWHKFQMWSTLAGTISFSIDGANLQTINTTVPSTTMSPMCAIKKSAANNSVIIDIDYWSGVMTGLGR